MKLKQASDIYEHEHQHEHNHVHDSCCGHTHEHHHSDCCEHEHSHSCCGEHSEHNHENHCCADEHSEHNHEHSSCSCGCGCGHEHNRENPKLLVIRLIIGAVLLGAGIFLEHREANYWFSFSIFAAAYIVLGYDIVLSALKNIFKGRVFDENFLMTIASIGAFIIGDHPEAAAVMLFYQIGEALQDKAVEKSRRSITELMDIRPDYANIEIDGKIKAVSPAEVQIGSIIIVRPGEKIPLDGTVEKGETFLDTSALTGESVPRKVTAGDAVLSGSINTSSPVYIRVDKEFSESTVSKILDMVEHAQSKKAHSEKFITVFARYYTPIVVIAALLLAFIPPLFAGEFTKWLYRGLMFLVVSCPCALVVSIPLGFFAGIGCASKNGILIKGSSYLEQLSMLDTVVFDKTGTLTKGIFTVNKIYAVDDESSLLETAAYAEFYSSHPIAVSIKNAFGADIDAGRISDYKEISGKGIIVKIDGKEILAGNKKLLSDNGIEVSEAHESGSVVYIASDGKFMGYLIISDEIKHDSKKAVSGLNNLGIKTVMLTGDSKESAEHTAEEIGIDKVYSQLLPQDKVARIEEILSSKQPKKSVAFTGDGINDAPVLSRADIGIAMGGLGSDSAIEAADIVLMTDEPSKLITGIKISRKTMKIVKENIVFAIGIKILVMLLSAVGLSTMWMAIFADVGVAMLAVLNSLRALRLNK